MAEAGQNNDNAGGIVEQSAPLTEGGEYRRLLRNLLLYHAALLLILVLGAIASPQLLDYLPVGGVERLASGGDATVALVSGPAEQIPDSEPAAMPVSRFVDRLGTAAQLVITLVFVTLLMVPVSWVHKGIHRHSIHDHSLDETTLILPGVVAAIVVVVQHSLALAFSLAGIVAGVQFRRALQDTFDALFILLAIGVGISAGVAALEIAAVLSVFFCYATIYVYFRGDGLESDFTTRKKQLKRMQTSEAGAEDSDSGKASR
jgi:hypothetical protein